MAYKVFLCMTYRELIYSVFVEEKVSAQVGNVCSKHLTADFFREKAS